MDDMASDEMVVAALGRPLGMLYDADNDKLRTVQDLSSDEKVVAALGRPFTLGMLYNACKDKLRTGFTLWDKKTLQEHMSEHSQHSSAFEVTTSDSIESKSKLLDIDASLKASFLCGLIELEGSAKYLNDQKKFKNQSRVTLQYKATTSFKQLSMTKEEAKKKMNTAVSESATHVVTGILYGANAFFVFDSEKLDASSIQEIQGSMQALIKKIPSFESKETASKNLNEEEMRIAGKFTCKFYGDFILPSNPTTFEEAVQTYVELPKLLKNNEESAVPLKVWLTPLTKFIPTACELKVRISTSLLRKVETALEDVGQAEMRCNESLDDEVLQNVPQISEKLKHFQKHCKDYKVWLQNKMLEKLNLIHKGQGQENTSLEKLLEDTKKSPFVYDNLSKWIKEKDSEITAIRSCVDIMKGTKAKMVANDSELKGEILAPDVEHALCFVFTLRHYDDPYLHQMAKYLSSDGSHYDENVTPSTQDLWYTSKQVLRNMTKQATAFRDLASNMKNNRFGFFIAAVSNDKYQGATIYHYKDDLLVTEDFSQPSISDVKTVTNREDLIWYACDLTMDPNTVNGWLTLSDGNKKATCGAWQYYPDHPQRFDKRPQVLCTEELTGRHYWEGEWGKGQNNTVGVGITYNRIERKGNSSATGLGSNDLSWYFGENKGYLEAWHNGREWSDALPPSGCSRVGVYLDWPAGTLSFYDATSTSLKHIYTFTTTFTEPVYPGFWVYSESNYARLCAV